MPSLPPPRTTELYYDGAWHPVSVRESAAVSITRGLSGKGTRAEPAAATMTLGNRSGEVSAHDPAAALYGKIGRNSPIRFSVEGGGPHLLFPSSGLPLVTTPDHASLGVSGDLDVRVDVAPTSWMDVAALVSRSRLTGSQVSYHLCIAQDRILQLLWSPTGSVASQRWAAATAPVPAYDGQRIVVRATLDINNGAGGCTVRFFYARRLDAAIWLPIGDPVTLSGTTSIFDGTAPLDIGDSDHSLTPDGFSGLSRLKGRLHAVQVYDGTTLDVDVRPETQAVPGASTFTDGAGRVWTLSGGVVLSNAHVRLEGEVPAWPPQRHVSGNDSTVAVNPAGIMRRLDTGKRPLDSAIRRHILAEGPIECWPLTDGADAAKGAALLAGQPAVLVPGSHGYSWGEGRLGSWIEPVFRMNANGGARLTAPCPTSSAATAGWSVDFAFSGIRSLLVIDVKEQGSSDSTRTWTLALDPSVNKIFLMTAPLTGGTTIQAQPLVDIFDDDLPHHVRLTTTVGGGTALWDLYVDGVLSGTGAALVDAVPPEKVSVLWGVGGSVTEMALGYLTYWGATAPDAADTYQALAGYPGESAGARVVRVAAEQGVTLDLDGEAAGTTALGVQDRDRLLDTLEVASKADMGLLLERRDARHLLYRARHTLYTQSPTVTLDYSAGIISGELRPLDDDRLSRNEVTAQRIGGAEHTAVQETGRMSVLDPPLGIGRYSEADEYSLAADEQAAGQAWWRLHVGVYGGLRYPKITVDLANPRAAALLHDLLAADVGDLLRLQHLPDEYGPGDVDLLIRGYEEEVGAKAWRITFICDPGGPWRVGIYGDATYGKCDTSGSQLTAGVNSSATSFSVTTTAGLPWITTPSEFPFTIAVGGEEMRVTAITGASSPQTFTVVRSTNGVVKSHAAAAPVALARPAIYAL
ncbi:hypothetical protein [Streptomyces sp. NPDC006477]|uniref:hypothetical protein n=1 Tax=Streptomyces sp. NPDC006477 TaxID=3364747 RepID=UPI0036D0A253